MYVELFHDLVFFNVDVVLLLMLLLLVVVLLLLALLIVDRPSIEQVVE